MCYNKEVGDNAIKFFSRRYFIFYVTSKNLWESLWINFFVLHYQKLLLT